MSERSYTAGLNYLRFQSFKSGYRLFQKMGATSDEEIAGKSRDFKITVFKGSKDLIWKFVKVKITDAVGWTLKGEMIQEIGYREKIF